MYAAFVIVAHINNHQVLKEMKGDETLAASEIKFSKDVLIIGSALTRFIADHANQPGTDPKIIADARALAYRMLGYASAQIDESMNLLKLSQLLEEVRTGERNEGEGE